MAIEGPPNFHAPFAAVNVQEFWRRWHMSLTSWVTDYLFTPLSMSLRGLGQIGLILCIMLNMVIIGLWHGLTLNFLVFGVLQGIFVSITALIVMSRRRAGAKADLGSDVARGGGHDFDFHAHEPFHDLLALGDFGRGHLHP